MTRNHRIRALLALLLPLLLLAPGGEPELDVTGVECSDEALAALLNPDRSWSAPLLRVVVDLPTDARIRVCNGPIHIETPINLQGNGARLFGHPSTGLTGLLACDVGADRTQIEDLELRYMLGSPAAQDNTQIALDVNCSQFTLKDSYIKGAGIGLNIDGNSDDGIQDTQNLNWPYVENVTIADSRVAGLRVRGMDASGGTFNGVRIFSTKQHFGGPPAVALEESSANGNTYVGALIEYSDRGIVVNPPGGLATSTFLGAYIEEGDTAEWLGNNSHSTLVAGGLLARLGTVNGDRVGAGNSRLMFRGKATDGTEYQVRIPGEDIHAAFWWRANADSNNAWGLFRDRWAPANTYRWDFKQYMAQNQSLVSLKTTGPAPWTPQALFGGSPMCTAVDACLE